MRQRPTSKRRAARIAAALTGCDWATPELEAVVHQWMDAYDLIPAPDRQVAGSVV